MGETTYGYDIAGSYFDDSDAEAGGGDAHLPKIDMKNLKYQVPSRALDHISCPICKLPFVDPWSTICGHTFCRECLVESFKSVLGKKCPLDRVELKVNLQKMASQVTDVTEMTEHLTLDEFDASDDVYSDDVYPAPIILSNITDDLIVCCLNETRGCTWKGERWSIKKHVVSSCNYTKIECVCGELCERKDLLEFSLLKSGKTGIFSKLTKEHINDNTKCPHTVTRCELCSGEVMGLDVPLHLETQCLKNEVKCSGCHLSFPKMHLEQHLNHCLNLFVDCPGSKYGCVWKGQRELFDGIHKQDCTFLKLSGYLDNVDEQLVTLKGENDSLKLQMSSMLDSVVNGKIYNLGFPLELEEVSGNTRNSLTQSGSSVFDTNTTASTVSDSPSISMPRVRSLIRELEVNQRVTDALVHENVDLRTQLNSQREAILNLQQTVQFMVIERRRMMIGSHGSGSSISGQNQENHQMGSKLTNKL